MRGAIVQGADVADRAIVEDVADVVIVGSGAAGATAARVLSERGVDVIVVEEGPLVDRESLRSDMYTTFANLWRDMGMQVAQGRSFTPVLQGTCVGGTTVINGAILHRMPEAIHAAWHEDRALGDALPYRELERIWDAMDVELSVGVAPPDVLGRNNSLLRDGLTRLGLAGNLIRRNVDGCRGSAHCNQGCPTGRKQSMDLTFVPYAVARGARVYATCRASRLLLDGDRAVGVEGRFDGRGGPRLVARARHAVIVAASAIATPLLLGDHGIGRTSRLVGERLQCHPGTGVSGSFDEPVRQWHGATQGYESVHYWHERMKFEVVGMPLEFGSVRLPGIGPSLVRRLASYGHVATWGLQIRAHTLGRVRRGFLGGKVIEYSIVDEDVRLLKLGVQRLVETMFAAGAREVFPGVHGLPERIQAPDEVRAIHRLPDDPRLFHCIAAHLFGTAVMGGSPRDSVVSPTLETHDVRRLYVTDSSVFPSNLGVNPQHTIAAVSWLASERIAERVAREKRRPMPTVRARAAEELR